MAKKLHLSLPSSPGVYIFKNSAGQILYIGKAKNLRKRVASYFSQPKNLPADKHIMMEQVEKLDHIVTDSEMEALLLETTLIKKHRPKYNILMKDDKSHQYIKVDYSWDFPKIYTVRQIEDIDRNSQYFGPFTDGWAVKKTVEMLRKLFRYRTCNREIPYDLSKIYSRSCLNHHIKLCLGPCIGAVTKEEYEQTIHGCVQFLQGKQTEIIQELKQSMKKESARKNFERAARLRDQLRDIEHIVAKQKVISPKKENLDIVSFFRRDDRAAFNLFLVRNGKLIGKENFTLEAIKSTSDGELMSTFLERYYATAKNLPTKIILQTATNHEGLTAGLVGKIIGKRKDALIVPERGKLKKLIEMGKQNAKDFWQREQQATADPQTALERLKEVLKLKWAPRRIEAYDVSNLQGTNPTASMIVFSEGKPDKKCYRRFKIRLKTTPDDVAMLHEALARRFKHQSDWPKPSLLVIDGGKPQLNAARAVLAENKLKVPVISLAKREEEIYTSRQSKPLRLAKTDSALQLLQRIRDEAHRFAISYHTKLRKKSAVKSALDSIPGIGPKTKKLLLQKFGSVQGIRSADKEELTKLIGPKKTKQLLENI